MFDEDNLVSSAGLVPVMTLAQQTGLGRLLGEKVRIIAPRIKSGSANPAPKLATVVAGMCAGADCIDDIDVLRSGGMKTLFDGVYAPSTVGTLLREFTFGHARQLESVLCEHLVVALCGRVDLLPGADAQVFIDIDSLLRPVYGHAKQGASYGHTKIAGKQILRKGLWPLATTISTANSAPVIAGLRLRAGKAGSGKGAGRMVAQAIGAARDCGASGQILVRGDSAYGTRKVVRACRRADARFSLAMIRNPAIERALAAIDENAWTPVSHPGAVRDPDTGTWISDAEVAEIPVEAADITHRQHAIIETVFADLIDGPLAHIPSGRFGANSAWVLCAAIAHNLLRAAGVLAGAQHTRARGSTLRRCDAEWSTSRPDWPAHSTDRSCTCLPTGHGHITGSRCGTTPSDTARHRPRQPDHPADEAQPERTGKLDRSATTSRANPDNHDSPTRQQSPQLSVDRG